ncbi:hypothetical protein C8R48DRAFT_769273 [Suillus tomentosus]|nr:hypothetical protein C8R48DRAFT_769273 [Suillus tomentosus]
MMKVKNNSIHDQDNSTEGRPSKRARLTSTGGEQNEGEKAKNSRIPTVPEQEKKVVSGSASMIGKRGSGAVQATLAVWTVLPNPTKCLIDEEEIQEYNETLIMQLCELAEYCNSKANIYALGKLLPMVTCGQYQPVNDHSKILCNPATGKPLTVWVVSRIAKMWFMKSGMPENLALLMIMLLFRSLAQQSATLLAKMLNPILNVNQQSTQVIWAIKWQNGKKNDGETEAVLFDAVYDIRAEGSLKTYSKRPLWSLADLKPRDLVLLEMKMTKYSTKIEDKWHSRMQYEMIVILLLDISEIPEEDA